MAERIRRPPADDPGDGRPCARGEHCPKATRAVVDGAAVRVPPLGPTAFCVSDQAIIRRCIARLPELFLVLARFTGVKVMREQAVRVPFGPGVPLNLAVDEVCRLMIDAVMCWHERVATVARLAVVDTQAWRAQSLGPYAGRCLQRSCDVLAEHLPVLVGLEPEWMRRPSCSPAALLVTGIEEDLARTAHAGQWDFFAGGVHAGTEFTRLDYLARAAMGLTAPPVTKLLGVECANCSERALRRADPPQHEGDTVYYSQCVSCGHLMTDGEYSMWVDRQWRFWEPRLTAEEIAGRGGLDAGLVRGLVYATREGRRRAVLAPAAAV